MDNKPLIKFFESYMASESLFLDKKALQSTYAPKEIPHRDKQIKQLAEILAPTLKLERPSNVFVYGKTGTGKTLSAKYTTQQIKQLAETKGLPIKIIYLNCKLKKIADTEYRLIAQLTREFGKEIPATGLPTDEVYKIFFSTIEKEKQTILLILDEIDQLVNKTGDEILYNLTRINEDLKNSQLSIIGISNSLTFVSDLDPRVKSSLSEEELVFPPYNALQIKDILKGRAEQAFKKDVLEQGLLEKCAAYSAREHGDARRALELLRVAAEIAERENSKQVKIKHIDEADRKIENDRVLEVVKAQPKQFQATLYAIISISEQRKGSIITGEAYDFYKNISGRLGLPPLTQRRISDIISEQDMLGIINTKVISKGRYGRTKEISVAIPSSLLPKIKKILGEGLDLA
ncbi:ORC1-type DNA replication protein [Candidatus Woesearchaeota archaeon]|nr:ORC1-type DNA replication protein [Candidatus Woesearchaeota archaeon]